MKSALRIVRHVVENGAVLKTASGQNSIRPSSVMTSSKRYQSSDVLGGKRNKSTEGAFAEPLDEPLPQKHFSPLHEITEDEKLIKDSARRFAEEVLMPRTKQMDEQAQIPQEVVSGLFEAGFMGMTIPEAYGGTGASFRGFTEAAYELNKGDMGTGTCMIVQNILVARNILSFGSEEIKRTYLPRLASNEIGSCCISEDGAGSDAYAMRTTAKKDGDFYVINGSKMWISNADYANVFLVFANVDPSKGYRGITLFVVDRDTPGLTVGKKINKLGLRSSGTAPVFFDNVRVPSNQVVGDVGRAYKYALEKLADGRICGGVQGTAVATSALRYTIKYLNERQQFGKKIWHFQAIQHQICDAMTRLEAAKLLWWNAVRRADAGLPYTKEACMAKYAGTEINSEITSKCISWMGGVGFTKDFPLERYYRDAPIGLIYEGTSNIQLNTIAKFWEAEGFALD